MRSWASRPSSGRSCLCLSARSAPVAKDLHSPVCPSRLCPSYNDCFYYRGRRLAEKAHIVITNHSVVINDALIAQASDDGKGMLGDFDFLILDEAHDFAQAALNGLEYELSGPRLGMLIGVAARLRKQPPPRPLRRRRSEMARGLSRLSRRDGTLPARPDRLLPRPRPARNPDHDPPPRCSTIRRSR